MATALSPLSALRNDYPTSDGKPMAETDWHRIQMGDTIETLDVHFDDNGDLDRESFLVKVVNGKQVVTATLPPISPIQ